MNRKGQETNAAFDLTYPEIIVLILSVLGVIIIGAVLIRWFNQPNSADLEKATTLSESLIARINAIEENKTINISSIQGFIADDDSSMWILTGWGKNDPNRPQKCFLESCIMICNKVSEDIKKDCEKAGVKQKVEQENVKITTENKIFQEFGSITIDSGKIAETNYIIIPKNLFRLEVTKTKDYLSINTDGIITIQTKMTDNIH